MIYSVQQRSKGRLRVRCGKWIFDEDEARGVAGDLQKIDGVTKAIVHSANGSILVTFDRVSAAEEALSYLDGLNVLALPTAEENTQQDQAEIDNGFVLDLIRACAWQAFKCYLMPPPLRVAIAVCNGLRYFAKGVKSLASGKLNVDVLDGTAITCAIVRRQFSTAGSVMFLLHVSDILADYTQARTKSALRQSLTNFADTAWVVRDGIETEVPIQEVQTGDVLRVRSGTFIPLDGTVIEGEA